MVSEMGALTSKLRLTLSDICGIFYFILLKNPHSFSLCYQGSYPALRCPAAASKLQQLTETV